MASSTDLSCDPTTDRPPRRPRRIPVSLRTFLVILAAVSTTSALWIGVPAYQQYAVIREVERLGGSYQIEPVAPKWLRKRIGDEKVRMFDDLTAINLFG